MSVNLFKYQIGIVLILLCETFLMAAPEYITDSIINEYQTITYINTDTVIVEDASKFHENQKALIAQLKGASLNLYFYNYYNIGTVVSLLNNVGRYEILIIKKVTGDTIIFESEIEYTYTLSEKPQLISVPEYDRAVVKNELRAKEWDGAKGGILALIANKSLTLDANINVSGAGFRGADPNLQPDFIYDCQDYDSLEYDSANFHFSNDHAAFKGEGFVTMNPATSKFNKGFEAFGNGGGGGIGKFSGGGGGSNIFLGGQGGKKSEDCDYGNHEKYAMGGKIDYSEGEFFSKIYKRINMGGGGGTSTQNLDSNLLATKGGDGGGIVIIITDTIIGNGHSILANGESVTDTATAGGGGGGGGGAIMLAADNFHSSDLHLYAAGGDGGWSKGTPFKGPGGGGGRGMIRYSVNAKPSNVNIHNSKGIRGQCVDYPLVLQANRGATSGYDFGGGELEEGDMIPALTGFLFNFISEDQYICAGETPQLLIGTKPKGGNGIYSYKWQEKTDKTPWTFVGDTAVDTLTYDPGILNDTTYFRRIVSSAGITDTSRIITIYVHDSILNNIIAPVDQLLCSFTDADTINGLNYSGGDNQTYRFQWESSPDNINFSEIPNDTNTYLAPTNLQLSTYYRRRLTSGVCIHYSDTSYIAVLPAIDSNIIFQDQQICYNDIPKPLTGFSPTGGNESTYDFIWEKSADAITWGNADGTYDDPDYSTFINLTDTFYYRRYVKSSECESNSNIITIVVLDSIENNFIYKNDTVCQDNRIILTGDQPTKGDKENYRYYWISSTDLVNWDTSTVAFTLQDYLSDSLDADIYFKRKIASGLNDACINISNQVKIKVWERINGNSIAASQEICHLQTPEILTGNSVTGGDMLNYDFKWQIRPNGESYSDMQNENGQMNYTFEYLPDPSQYYIRRRVISDVCTDYSDSISLLVLSQIGGNIISNNDFACYNTPPSLFNSNTLIGGSGIFSYKWIISNDSLTGYSNAPGDSTAALYQAPGLTSKTYFKRIVTSSACIDTSNIFTIGILPLPVARVINNSNNMCSGDDLKIKLRLTGQPPWVITYLNENSISSNVNVDETDTTVLIQPTATFTFNLSNVRDGNNCDATDISGSNMITVYDYPDEGLAGEDTAVCGNTIQLFASDKFSGTWLENADVDIENVKDVNSNASVSEYGSYPLVLNSKNWNCISNDTIYITFDQEPLNVSVKEEVITLNFKFETEIEAEDPIVGTGLWSTKSKNILIEDSSKNITNLKVANNKFGTYSIYWTVSNGVCPAVSDTVFLYVKDVEIPKGFSPNNGDDINNYFIIEIDEQGSKELVVFNRWGQEVYYSNDYQNDWNGVNKNGEDLPEGTYFYVVKIESVGITKTGYVVLKRE